MYVKFADLPVHDQDRAIAFYEHHLGMTVARDQSYGSDWRWIELAVPGGQTNLLMAKATVTNRAESPALALAVDDIESLHSTLSSAGVEIKQSPEASPWNPAEVSMLFYDSEENLILVTSNSLDESEV